MSVGHSECCRSHCFPDPRSGRLNWSLHWLPPLILHQPPSHSTQHTTHIYTHTRSLCVFPSPHPMHSSPYLGRVLESVGRLGWGGEEGREGARLTHEREREGGRGEGERERARESSCCDSLIRRCLEFKPNSLIEQPLFLHAHLSSPTSTHTLYNFEVRYRSGS